MGQTLILHIGTGKTGSTAIQRFLRRQRAELAKHGCYYWGLNLEHAPNKSKRDWQKPGGIGLIRRMAIDRAITELNEVLEEALAQTDEDSKIILSNESIYEMPLVYQPVIRDLCDNRNIDVSIVAYARSMPGYIMSAYKQWGVKHKTNTGPIMSFREWLSSSKSFIAYSDKLLKWEEAFGDNFNVYNYDILANVVEHFAKQYQLAPEVLIDAAKGRPNSSPDDATLAVYALYNGRFAEPVLPNRIDELLSENDIMGQLQYLKNLSDIFPTREALDKHRHFIIEETSKVNKMLRRHNQPDVLSDVEGSILEPPSDDQVTNYLLSILLTIAIRQDDRLKKLEGKTT